MEYTKDGITVKEVPCGEQTCKDCYFGTETGCDYFLLEQLGVPDCVFDREAGKEVIYKLK